MAEKMHLIFLFVGRDKGFWGMSCRYFIGGGVNSLGPVIPLAFCLLSLGNADVKHSSASKQLDNQAMGTLEGFGA